jgi:5-methylcytosine-specific restriction endonuclease McrA
LRDLGGEGGNGSSGDAMVPRLLKRLAGHSPSTSGEGTQSGRVLTSARQGQARPDRGPLPTSWLRMHVWWRDQGRCVLCGEGEGVWFDYIIPVREGGRNTADNIRLICERCKRDERGASTRRKRRLRS